MANDLALMGSAFYSRLGTVQYTYVTSGTVTTTGSVGVWDTQAVQGTAVPYVIFQYQAGVDDYAFSDSWQSLSMDFAVKAVSNRLYPVQARQIYSIAHTNLQDAPLVIPGYALMRCRRRSPFEYRDSDQYIHSGGIYRVDIVKIA